MAEERDYRKLATYCHWIERLNETWPRFQAQRADRLRHGGETEKVAEGILEDLFVGVLDWDEGDLTYGIGHADIVLSRNLAKYLVIEVKRPGTLELRRSSFNDALAQAQRYANEQKITRVAASDGRLLYAANVESGGLEVRVVTYLDAASAPEYLWWLTMHGIYHPHRQKPDEGPTVPDAEPQAVPLPPSGQLLHPKYHLPASCFAYVGDANTPRTWRLPYLQADGSADAKRLPKAIQALLSNYRGAKVRGIPEKAVLDILLRLARVAAREGRLPHQCASPSAAYVQLLEVLRQQGVRDTALIGSSS